MTEKELIKILLEFIVSVSKLDSLSKAEGLRSISQAALALKALSYFKTDKPTKSPEPINGTTVDVNYTVACAGKCSCKSTLPGSGLTEDDLDDMSLEEIKFKETLNKKEVERFKNRIEDGK